MPLYLGLDSSTQSLSAVVIEIERHVRGERHDRGERNTRRVVFESSLSFDEALPHYGTHHGVLPQTDHRVATSSPLMWAEAMDLMMSRLAQSGIDLSRLAAVCGSAQQHGSVFLNATWTRVFEGLSADRPIARQIQGIFSRETSPIWMDSSTSEECAEITAAVGGAEVLAARTGSRAFERFTGPQIRRFFKQSPDAYDATARVHLVSSFLASLLAGMDAPVDPGDGSGMNLMDLASRRWWQPALDSTAPELDRRLPRIAPAHSVVGPLSSYWRTRYGLPAASVIAWSGDNPCSLVGTGLVNEGRVAVSLGTSDTVFGLMCEPRVDATGTGHVFGSPTGDFMGLTCFQNGSLARERIRDLHRLDWGSFSRALDGTPPQASILLPWFEPEITPAVPMPGVRRYGLSNGNAGDDVRALIDSQMMAMARHSRWMGVAITTIHATGGAAANRPILQTMADVFGAEVYRLEVANSAALGAALRAAHADLNAAVPTEWDEVIAGFVEPLAGSRLVPDAQRHDIYRKLIEIHGACEAHALGRGPDPSPLLERFRAR